MSHLPGNPQDPTRTKGREVSEHITKTETFDNGVRTTCTCGWIDRWPVADGSAQQAAYAHKKRHERNPNA